MPIRADNSWQRLSGKTRLARSAKPLRNRAVEEVNRRGSICRFGCFQFGENCGFPVLVVTETHLFPLPSSFCVYDPVLRYPFQLGVEDNVMRQEYWEFITMLLQKWLNDAGIFIHVEGNSTCLVSLVIVHVALTVPKQRSWK